MREKVTHSKRSRSASSQCYWCIDFHTFCSFESQAANQELDGLTGSSMGC